MFDEYSMRTASCWGLADVMTVVRPGSRRIPTRLSSTDLSRCTYIYLDTDFIFHAQSNKMESKARDSKSRPRVVVVGAGVGGVATAARLAAAGCKVTVLEKNGFSGGRCSLIHRDGYVRLQMCSHNTARV